MNQSPFHLESLLEHRAWLRRLANGLIADPALAEDAVQETLIQAWQSPPADASRPRGWLATVLKNRVRQDQRSGSRRSDREAAFEPALASAPDPAEVLAEQEQQALVAGIVNGLDGPYRETLLLIYWRGLSAAQVAAQLGCPAATVRSRAKRGMALVREELDRRHDGQRAAWALPMARWSQPPLALVSASATIGIGALAAAAGALLLVLAGVAWWNRPLAIRGGEAQDIAQGSATRGVPAQRLTEQERGTSPNRAPSPAQPQRQASTSEHEATVSFADRSERQEIALAAVSDRSLVPQVAHQLVLVDVANQPLPGRTVTVQLGSGEQAQPFTSDEAGIIELDRPERCWVTLGAAEEGWWLWKRQALWSADEPQSRTLLVPALAANGVVRDGAGRPLVADLQLEYLLHEWFEVDLKDLPRESLGGRIARSNEQGGFAFEPMPWIRPLRVTARAEGFEAATFGPEDFENGFIEIELLPEPKVLTIVAGQVLNAAGDPAREAQVELLGWRTPVDAQGRFEIQVRVEQGVEFLPADLVATAPGQGMARIERIDQVMADHGFPIEGLELRLEELSNTLSGRVLDAEGRPVVGMTVWPSGSNPTMTAQEYRDYFQTGIPPQSKAMEWLAAGIDAWPVTGSDGKFVLRGLGDGPIDLIAVDLTSLVTGHLDQVAPGAEAVEIRLDPEPGQRTLGFRTVTREGATDSGIGFIRHGVAQGWLGLGGATWGMYTTSDESAGRSLYERTRWEDGIAWIDRLPTQGIEAGMRATTYSDGYPRGQVAQLIDLEGLASGAVIDVSPEFLCEVQLCEPVAEADRACFLDAQGVVLVAQAGQHSFRECPLQDGRSAPLLVSEAAVEVVYYAGERELERHPVQLDWRGPNELSW